MPVEPGGEVASLNLVEFVMLACEVERGLTIGDIAVARRPQQAVEGAARLRDGQPATEGGGIDDRIGHGENLSGRRGSGFTEKSKVQPKTMPAAQAPSK